MKMNALLNLSRIKTTLTSILLLFLFNLQATGQEILIRDGSQYIKVDMSRHSSFSSSLILSEFHGIKDAKVVISDESGVIYIYPSPNMLMELHQRVSSIISQADSLDSAYSKDEKDLVISALNTKYGKWLTDYAHTGVRENANDSCHLSMPFCTGTIYTFPAGVGPGAGTPAQKGPYYKCLSTQPNPAWYYLKIDEPGSIGIYMSTSPLKDIDFCLWGPFTDPVEPCPMNFGQGGLTPSKVVDCSYSSAQTETANITSGEQGQYYILVITNYSNDECQITFQQTSGDGTTDCTILPPAASTNSPVCTGDTIRFHAADSPGALYHWTGPNNFISAQQNPVIPNAQIANYGVYALTITVQGNSSDPTTTEVVIVDPPTATLTALTSTNICQGDSVQFSINATSTGPFRAAVSASNILPHIYNFITSPCIIWLKPSDTTTYTLSSISNTACYGTSSGSINVKVRPMPVPLFNSHNLCASLATSFTDQSSVTGGSISSWDWDFGDNSTSNLQNPDHTYTTAGNYNITLAVTANNACTNSVTVPVTLKPTPTVNAGNNSTIGYGTFTQLNGTVSGGSGTHTLQWEPANKVDNATILNPNTVSMDATTDFTLTANDNNGCQKSDAMTVTITGGPVAGSTSASPAEICIGESSLLNTLPSGGSGNYTYSWSSNPSGFSSTLEDPTVTPLVTTTYFLTIDDGFHTVQAQTTVIVNQKPLVNAGDDATIAHGTNITLVSSVSGGTSPYQYAWSPANLLNSPNASTTQTHNLFSSQNFTLQVTDSKGCDQSDAISVTISGGPLSVNPYSETSVICRNESTHIIASPGGGSGHWASYNWTSSPAGFTSNEAEPKVTPAQTTIYTVTVDDGYNTAQGSVTVTVNQLPQIDLIPDDPKVQVISPVEIGICVFDTITINAGNPGKSYLWSNGSTNQTILLSTSGISFDQQTYNVVVTDPTSGCSNNASITANFTFANCSYGIEENPDDNRMKVYPNPSGTGLFNVMVNELKGKTELEVYNTYGKLVYTAAHNLLPGTTFKEVLNLQNAPNGVYFLKLMNNEAVIISKLIIQ